MPEAIYPWNKWFQRKKPFTLRHKVDYKCETHTMIQQFRNQASMRNIRVQIRNLDQKAITVRVFG